MSRILLVGAGPAALAAAVALRCHDLDGDLEVVDPSGAWLTAWRRRFAQQDIPHLRSPAVHHPHPDPFALLGHEGGDGLVPSGGTKLPTTDRFERFVDHLVEEAGLRDRVVPTAARALTLDATGRATVHLADGTSRRPDHVVLCTNARRPVVPGALRALDGSDLVEHGEWADVRSVTPGERLVVIGGGLSAAHLALGAARRGATVVLLARRRLRVRRFDTHPSWLGPKKRRPFEAEPDPRRRRTIIDHARGGGSVPPRIRRDLQACVEAGSIDLRERAGVLRAETTGDRLVLHLEDGDRLRADRIWSATGGSVDVAADALCRELLTRCPVPLAGGLPDLPPDLRWPGTNVHLTGFATGLRLGPTAGNLVGHRRAALRLVASLRGTDPDLDDRIRAGAGACPGRRPVARPASAPGTRR
ncbi:FAD-dependent oxidoreductase [Egicoccus sp. AB-alg2]|uniref:FAD-dependent oxidoreductase n=1 Tax=Egicoccus sp. AB-alg2 TaxID=3242693 RepID=UPI00359F027A